MNAFRLGKPKVLHYAPEEANENRKLSLKSYPVESRKLQRDEYPYASTREGGKGALVNYVPRFENSIQGGQLSGLYRYLNSGDSFVVVPVPIYSEPDEEYQQLPVPLPLPFPVRSPRPSPIVSPILIRAMNFFTPILNPTLFDPEYYKRSWEQDQIN